MKILLWIAFMMLPLSAQQKDKPAVALPRITAEQRARFWRAQTEALVAGEQAQKAIEQARKAQEALAAVRAEVCGEAFNVAPDTNGEPSCQAKQAKETK